MTKQMVFKRFLKTDIDSVITEALWTDVCVCVCLVTQKLKQNVKLVYTVQNFFEDSVGGLNPLPSGYPVQPVCVL